MPSPFDAARLSLQAACLGATGNLKVTYTRGNSSIANLPAVPGKSQLASDSMTPGRLAFETHDFMIQTSLLAVGGVSWFPPLEGDRIASGGTCLRSSARHIAGRTTLLCPSWFASTRNWPLDNLPCRCIF